MKRPQWMIRVTVLMITVFMVLFLPGSAMMQDLGVEGLSVGYGIDVDNQYGDELLQNPNNDVYIYIWLNGDGSELDRQGYPERAAASTSKTPVKDADENYTYTFNRWNEMIREANGAYFTIYIPVFTEQPILRHTLTIHYQYGDGTQAAPDYQGNVSEGTQYAVSSPVLERYNSNPSTVSGTMGTQDIEETVTYTETSTAPGPVYVLVFEPEPVKEYTIRFVDEDGTELQSGYVAAGEMPAYVGETPTKEATPQYAYTFSAWSPAVVEVTEDATYTATYSETLNHHIVRFVNEDGTELQSGEVPFGEIPTYTGDMPEKAADAQYTYTFYGWMPEITSVASPATYTATYTETLNEYTVRFVNEEGEEWQSGKVVYGTMPVPPETTPGKEATAQYSYTFEAWTPEIQPVTGDATYTAAFSETVNEYTVRFENEDGVELQESRIAYGATPVYSGETPKKTATAKHTYTFKKWKPTIRSVTGDVTYTASYKATVNSYTIRFVDEDGTELQNDIIAYGEMPAYSGETPAKAATAQYTYTFGGWTPDIGKVREDATYTAVYTREVNRYTVRFVDEDGTELQRKSVAYGDMPVYTGATPTKDATVEYTYSFSNWEPAIGRVTGYATYQAAYTASGRKYTVRYYCDTDWTKRTSLADKNKYQLWWTQEFYYGITPYLTKQPQYENYVYDPPLQPVTADADYYVCPTEVCPDTDEGIEFGTLKTFGDHSFYVNEQTGETSAIISSEKGEITWLRDESDGTAAWYGFNNNPEGNTQSALPAGSVVSVNWVSKDNNPMEFEKMVLEASEKYGLTELSQLSDSDNKVWVFELNAYKKMIEDGKYVYEPANQQDFKDKTEVYIELGDDWDINDIEAIWLDENEKMPMYEIVTQEINGVEKRFAVFSLNHFSTYLLIVRGTF